MSALFAISRRRRSLNRKLFDLITSDSSQAPSLFFSELILEEYDEVVHRPDFRFDPVAVADMMRDLRRVGHRVRTRLYMPPLEPDPDDTEFQIIANAAPTHYLITNNLKHYPKIPYIITSLQFFRLEYPELLGRK